MAGHFPEQPFDANLEAIRPTSVRREKAALAPPGHSSGDFENLAVHRERVFDGL